MPRIVTALSLPQTRPAARDHVGRRPRLLAPLRWGAQVIGLAAYSSLRSVRKARQERGQALIEFALLLPIVLVFLLVMVDFGMAVDHRLVIQHALSEGVREAQVTDQLADITDTTVDQSQGLLDPADVTVCYEDQNGNGDPGEIGDKVRVAVEYTYQFSAGGGELMLAFGVTPPSILMDPSAVAALQNKVDGAPSC